MKGSGKAGAVGFANEAAPIDLSIGFDWGDNNPKRFILSMLPTTFRSDKVFPREHSGRDEFKGQSRRY